MISEAIDFLVKEFQAHTSSSLNIRQLDAEEISAEEILEEACTPPFFSDKRLLIVKNVDRWSVHDQKKIVPFLKRPPEFTVLVLTGETPGKLNTVSRVLRKRGAIVMVDLPRDRDLIEWIRNRVRLKGKNIGGKAAAHLLELVGKDLRELSNAIDKLVAYVEEKQNIDPGDVSEALDDIRERSIFELTDSVGIRNLPVALKSLKRLLETGYSPLGVTSMLNRQFRLLWQAKAALEEGKSISELANILETAHWIARKYARQADNFTMEEIKVNLEFIYEADKTLKNTMVPPELCLDLLLLKLFSRSRKYLALSPASDLQNRGLHFEPARADKQ